MTSSDEREHLAEYERLVKELKEHPGTEADEWMRDVESAGVTWYQRSQELYALLDYGETDEEMQIELMQNVRPPVAREEYLRSLDSTLNAYLAALGALIDVARRVSRKLPESFQAEYTDKSNEVRAMDGVAVIRNLRNYILHYGSAPWRFSGEMTADSMTSRIGLDSGILMKWESWGAESRTYLDAHEMVHISRIIAPYQEEMKRLFEWFADEFYKFKQPDIDAANDLVRRVNLHLTGGASDGRDWHELRAHIEENIRRKEVGEPQINYQTGLPIIE